MKKDLIKKQESEKKNICCIYILKGDIWCVEVFGDKLILLKKLDLEADNSIRKMQDKPWNSSKFERLCQRHIKRYSIV